MTFRALAGGGSACAYCGFCLVMEGPRQCCPAGRDYDALAAENAALKAQLAYAASTGDECAIEVESLRSRLASADREATVLVVAMADQCGAPDNWKPLPDVAGKITQISNMVAGLREERALIVTRAENAEAALAYASSTGDECAIEVEALRSRLAEETAIVDRIWDIYGRPTYEQLAGRSIYDLINADRARLADIRRIVIAANRLPDGRYILGRSDAAIVAICDGATDSAPAVQPCGHPWKAQHDFKCILCSSADPRRRDATSAQLAEAQMSPHSAAGEKP